MARYFVINEHVDGQCDEMEALLGHSPEHLKGTDVWCTCPSGEHAWFMLAEGSSTADVLDRLPDELRIGSTRGVEMAAATL